jgi:hypothetical protein
MINNSVSLFIIMLFALLLSTPPACSNFEQRAPESGVIELRASDPPPPEVNEVPETIIIYLNDLKVHKSGAMDNGWVSISGTPSNFDLMKLNGVEQIILTSNLTVGDYDMISLSVTKVTGETTFGNSFDAEFTNPQFTIAGTFGVTTGNKTTLTIDFNGAQSLTRTQSGNYSFNPVATLIVNSTGSLVDWVSLK